MDKREEIREGIANITSIDFDGMPLKDNPNKADHLHLADLIMADESKRGVVIKVDGELPDCRTYEFINIDECKRECDKMIMAYDCPLCRAGYVAVEPLIGVTDGNKV